MNKRHLIEGLESRLMLSTTSNDPNLSSQWALNAIDAQAAWDTTTGSSKVVVASIDTGIEYTHPDLYQNIWINQSEIPAAVKAKLVDSDSDRVISFRDLNAAANKGKTSDLNHNGYIDAGDLLAIARNGGWSDGVDTDRNGYKDDIIGWDFANNDNNPLDGNGHGTHTAGIIAAAGNNGAGISGVAWNASLMAIKILDDRGYGTSVYTIAAAIRYSADMGAKVSNNSWGGTVSSAAIYNAIAYAQSRGQIFVAAAGNDGQNNDSPWYGSYPSDYNLSNIISVAATTSTGGLASYSNYGYTNVDIAAPGSDVLSTYLKGTYKKLSGTSMATPQVTGAIALMLAKNPSLTAAQIKSALINGADQSAALYGLTASGGELNVANALAGKTGTRYTPTTAATARNAPVSPQVLAYRAATGASVFSTKPMTDLLH